MAQSFPNGQQIKVLVKGTPTMVDLHDGWTVADIRGEVTGAGNMALVCTGQRIGSDSMVQMTNTQEVAEFQKLSFAAEGTSNVDKPTAKVATPKVKKVKMTNTFVIPENAADTSDTSTVKALRGYITRAATAFNRAEVLIANPNPKLSSVTQLVADEEMGLSECRDVLKSAVSNLPSYAGALAEEAQSNEASASASEVLLPAARVFAGTGNAADTKAVQAFIGK